MSGRRVDPATCEHRTVEIEADPPRAWCLRCGTELPASWLAAGGQQVVVDGL